MAKASLKNKKNINIKSFIKKNISGWTLILPTVLMFVLIVWRPIVIAFGYSFFKLKGFEPVEFVGTKNFVDVLTDTNFLKTLWNTVQYVFWSLIIGFPLPFIVAVMINEMIKTKGFFKVVTYLPVIIPGIANYLIWKFIYADGAGGLLNMFRYFIGIAPMDWLSNTQLAIPLIIIAMTWQGFGATVVIFLASLQGVDQSLYEAARLDGAGVFMRIKTVMLPHMYGILALSIIRQIIGVFQVTEQPLVMTGGGPNGATLSIGLTNYLYAFKYGQFDKSMALGVVTFLLLIGLTFVYFRMDKKIND
ncbi:MAG: sugar ABC transporter permease [Clostridia bacterium]|nr:sugar ABC transporter permease [Clostridia bacterium]